MEWLIYLLKVSICMGLFYAFYHLFLQKLTFFSLNRAYLLTTLVLSLTVPAIQFQIERIKTVEKIQEIYVQELPVDQATQALPANAQPQALGTEGTVLPGYNWQEIVSSAYWGIAVVILLVFLVQIGYLLTHLKKVSHVVAGLKVIYKPKGFTNCSFLNYVFVDNQELSAEEIAVMMQHESVHAIKLHSIDKLFLNLCRAILWFNPVVYLYDRALEQVHEYEADKIASGAMGSASYASLLLSIAVRKGNAAITHSFVKSPIKARITMLFINQSRNMKKLIYLAGLPLLSVLLWSFSLKYTDKIIERAGADHSNETVNTNTRQDGGPFRYEVNRVKFVDGTITKVTDPQADKKNIEIVSGRDTLLLKATKTQVPLAQLSVFKKGEQVRLRFVHEFKYRANFYSVGDWVAITKDTASYGIINKKTFDFFYNKYGVHGISNSAVQELPFVREIVRKDTKGRVEYRYEVNPPRGKQMVLAGTFQNPQFLISGKVYSFDEAKKFDRNFIEKLSLKQGSAITNDYNYTGLNEFGWVFWFGEEPPLSDLAKKKKDAYSKYHGKTLDVEVTGYAFGTSEKKPTDGFYVKTTDGVSMKVFIETKFAEQIKSQLKIGDRLKVVVKYVDFWKNEKSIVLGNSILIKDGKTIFDKGRPVTSAGTSALKKEQVQYSARDSARINKAKTLLSLYGNVNFKYKTLDINADEVTYNLLDSTVVAKNMKVTDVDGKVKYIGTANFRLK